MGHRLVQDLLLDDVIVEEKVDGSQFSFGLIDGELKIKSKGAIIYPDAPPAMFRGAVETVLSIQDKLIPGWTYRAEVLSRPKHNVLAYDRVPQGNLILFDIAVGLEDYMLRSMKVAEAQVLGLEIVPVVYTGKVTSAEQVIALLDRTSILGGQKIEGVVVKNYSRFGIDGKPLMAKYVAEAFKEVHKGEWRKENPTNNDVVTLLVNSLRTPARWSKAVQHLREAGTLTDSPKDIGPLLHEMQKDVEEEEKQLIIERLYKWAWPHIRRGITHGFPEWYKEQLLVKQFETMRDQGIVVDDAVRSLADIPLGVREPWCTCREGHECEGHRA
jgi:hypothetical protein